MPSAANSTPIRYPTRPPPRAAVTMTSAIPIPRNATPNSAVAPRYKFIRHACFCFARAIPTAGFGRPQRQSRYGLQTGIASDASCGDCLLPRHDHHAGGRVLEDEVDGLAEDRPLRPIRARRADDDDLRLAPLCLADDRASRAPGTQQPSDHVDAVELTDRDCRV